VKAVDVIKNQGKYNDNNEKGHEQLFWRPSPKLGILDNDRFNYIGRVFAFVSSYL
jgi:hypothetical protein